MQNRLFKKPGHPYYIAAPDYRENSSGIRVMHYLCHALNLQGFEAYTVGAGTFNPDLKTPNLTSEAKKRHLTGNKIPIAVYPEVVAGNPLGAQVCVRYMLNREGLIAGNRIDAGKDDLFFYYSKAFIPNPHDAFNYLKLSTYDLETFKPDPEQKTKKPLLYLNRISKSAIDFSTLPKDIEILSNRTPLCYADLAKKLQSASVLYSYELSGTCTLAMLCGCPLVALNHPEHEKLGFSDQSLVIYQGCGYTRSDSPEGIQAARDSLPEVRKILIEIEQNFWNELEVFTRKTQDRADEIAREKAKPLAFESEQTSLAKGIESFTENDNETALQHFSWVIEASPQNPLPYVYLALISARDSLPDDAGSFLDFALSLTPGRHDFVAALGEEFLKQGDHERALTYLQRAIDEQPDLLMAYPALAESLRLNGRMDAAINLLRGAAWIASPAQGTIQELLLEWLTAQGNVLALSELCLQWKGKPAHHALGILLLVRTDKSTPEIDAEINRHAQLYLPEVISPPPATPQDVIRPIPIAFLVSDFAREALTGRLENILQHLPPDRFLTIVACNDSKAGSSETAQRSSLLCDHWLNIEKQDDAQVLQTMRSLGVRILADLDGLDVANRLALLCKADVPLKFSWSDIAMPRNTGIPCLAGTALHDGEPHFALPGLGEMFDLPPVGIETRPDDAPLALACLVAAIHVSEDSWKMFAEILAHLPASTLRINLAKLGKPAQDFIESFFRVRDIDLGRLEFVHALDAAALCTAWNSVDLGLAPLHGPGGMALPTCLWMDRPYIALRGEASWSRRPGALLQSLGLDELVADSPEAYLALASALSRQQLARYRGLRQRLENSPGADIPGFVRAFADTIEQRLLRGH